MEIIAYQQKRRFVFEDTVNHDYRYIRAGLLRRGWQQVHLPQRQRSSNIASMQLSRCLDVATKSTPDRAQSSQAHRQNAMMVVSTGKKRALVPDLVWTVSSARTAGVGHFGKGQATNFFDRSWCLTTKAGLCRTLRNTNDWGPGRSQDVLQSSMFFPRTFDLSDQSQMDDFKDNFRQTAAAAVLKTVVRRADQDGHHPFSSGERQQACGASDAFNCVHAWMLTLAVRVCRRRLLKTSGWREEFTGQSPSTVDGGAIGVKVLKRQEWDSLLLYSYILRKVESSRSESLGPTRIVDAGQDKHVSQRNAENEDIEPRGSGVDNASCFDCAWYTAGVSCKESTVKKTRLELKTQLPRRPSSAPARRQHPNMTTRGRRSSGRLQRVASSGLTNTVHRETTRSGGVGHAWYGAWQAEESAELHDGLFKVWNPAGAGRSRCCVCTCGVPATFRTTNHASIKGGSVGSKEDQTISRLIAEAQQLCIALEKKCTQWKIDGERNLWILKPAGASKGHGVRLAWTMEQVLHAQATMGGRIVQKYIETPLLFFSSRYRSETDTSAQSDGERRLFSRNNAHFEKSSGIEHCWSALQYRGAGVPRCERGTPIAAHATSESSCGRKGSGLDSVGRGGAAHDGSVKVTGSDDCKYDGDHVRVSTREGAKFDLRFWVLVTRWDPLEAFLYDECYLRVCPRPFSLAMAKLADPEVHITNLCVRQAGDSRAGTCAIRRGRQRDHRPWRNRLFACSQSGGPVHGDNRGDQCDPGCSNTFDEGGDTCLPGASSPLDGMRVSLEQAVHETQTRSQCFVASRAEFFRRLGEVENGNNTGNGSSSSKDGPEHGVAQARGERVWETKVFPSTNRLVKSTLVAAQPHMNSRDRSFQLFGFDVILDRELHPWLLEVNLSPAMSHTSTHQSRVIRSMCEGLLRLTIDQIFPAAESMSVSTDQRSGEAVTHGGEGASRLDDDRPSPYGQWKPIVTAVTCANGASSALWAHPPAVGSNETPFVSRFSASTSPQRIAGAPLLCVRGRHLSRRTLTRAEQGVREAWAMKVLVRWWKSSIECIRELRDRKSYAGIIISRWLIIARAQQRQRALKACQERSATALQRGWRRAVTRNEQRNRSASEMEACDCIQAAWRRHKLRLRFRSRRACRKVLACLRVWALSLLARRRRWAAIMIAYWVAASMSRQQRRRWAAELISARVYKVCIFRSQERSRLQRFARLRCLLPIRLATLRARRIARMQVWAQSILVRALRMAIALSARTKRAIAARKLQAWFRATSQMWRRRCASATTLQRAWRQTKKKCDRRRVLRCQRMVDDLLHRGIPCAIIGGSPRSTHRACLSHCRTSLTKPEDEVGTSSMLSGRSSSLATTTHEAWIAPEMSRRGIDDEIWTDETAQSARLTSASASVTAFVPSESTGSSRQCVRRRRARSVYAAIETKQDFSHVASPTVSRGVTSARNSGTEEHHGNIRALNRVLHARRGPTKCTRRPYAGGVSHGSPGGCNCASDDGVSVFTYSMGGHTSPSRHCHRSSLRSNRPHRNHTPRQAKLIDTYPCRGERVGSRRHVTECVASEPPSFATFISKSSGTQWGLCEPCNQRNTPESSTEKLNPANLMSSFLEHRVNVRSTTERRQARVSGVRIKDSTCRGLPRGAGYGGDTRSVLQMLAHFET